MSALATFYVLAIQVNILFAVKPCRTECDRIADFKGKDKGKSLSINVIANYHVTKPMECAFKCIDHELCKSYNYEHNETGSTQACELLDKTKAESPSDYISRPGFTHYESDSIDYGVCQENPCKFGGTCIVTCESHTCLCQDVFKGLKCEIYDGPPFASCNEIQNENLPFAHFLTIAAKSFQVFCDNDWILIARFSNADDKNWMNDIGYFWYDREEPYGDIHLADVNTDMISPAFWLVKGTEFRITQSNDIEHTSLLTTQGGCLDGTTFREKISSYGLFRGSTVWAINECQGTCAVSYSGSYTTVQGFKQSACNGSIQSSGNIGFWCDYSAGDSSVMMIGGGGSECDRADHGIGITEADSGMFETISDEYDFGDEALSEVPTDQYSLNL